MRIAYIYVSRNSDPSNHFLPMQGNGPISRSCKRGLVVSKTRLPCEPKYFRVGAAVQCGSGIRNGQILPSLIEELKKKEKKH